MCCSTDIFLALLAVLFPPIAGTRHFPLPSSYLIPSHYYIFN